MHVVMARPGTAHCHCDSEQQLQLQGGSAQPGLLPARLPLPPSGLPTGLPSRGLVSARWNSQVVPASIAAELRHTHCGILLTLSTYLDSKISVYFVCSNALLFSDFHSVFNFQMLKI